MDGSMVETWYRLFLGMTGVLLTVLLLRLPLRYAFGSRIAYGIWLLVPIAMMGLVAGSLAPMSAFTPMALPVQVSEVRLPWSPVPTAPSSAEPMNWIVIAWIFGAMLFAVMQWWQQWTFVRRLGVLRPMPDGVWMSESADIGPAVVGVFPPRTVLPTDFYQRFTVPEQTFALAHESMHIRRRDPLVNLLVAIVRSLCWFHPLVHLAVRYFRIDQEFACDADVLTVHTQDRHHYASAILKGQLSSPALPAGCHLDSYTAVSLKRRFRMLQTPLPRRGRRILGTIIIAASAVTSAGLSWAQVPAENEANTQYQMSIKLWENGELKHQPVIVFLAGREAEIVFGENQQYKINATATPYPTAKGPDISLSIALYTTIAPSGQVGKASYQGIVKQGQVVSWGGRRFEVVTREIKRTP
jgi:beta-lactamase regulating signal transducer with metallopeptidase domain